MAGIAFSNAMVGLVHSLGHATGGVCHLPHGLVMNLYMPYVLEYNLDTNGDRIAELLLPLAGADVYAATPAAERALKAIATIREMRDAIYDRCKLPRTLQETGKVSREQLPLIADQAINDGSIISIQKKPIVLIWSLFWNVLGAKLGCPNKPANPPVAARRQQSRRSAATGADCNETVSLDCPLNTLPPVLK